jgi:hypothetical protein
MFCIHKWSELSEGRQRCTKCGKYSVCHHEFDIIKIIKVFDYSYSTIPFKYKFMLQCKHCGVIHVKET